MADTPSGKMTLEESGKMHSQIEAVTPSGDADHADLSRRR
jgi:hypothetical protein